ncbi:hypothetical protein [Nocardioides ferulae]|uniref:hypothetical protein n=1 Tax=Nocardioides ferulae TaxID=2340821 RepID=UPI000F87C79E|nr:hypothetical protein [Nocardioides ferulae]
MTGMLVGFLPEIRHHMFGGTDLRTTTVVSAEEGTRSDSDDRPVAYYRVSWRDDAGRQHFSTFKRSGPVRHHPGDSWPLWVSAERAGATNDESPLVVWFWLAGVLPLASAGLGLLWQWRQRVFARGLLRGVERRERRRARG